MCAGGSTDCMAIDYAISVNVQDFGIITVGNRSRC